MAIIIRNLGGDPKTQLREYEVRINDKVIAKFKHDRKDGLWLCLLQAASAVRNSGKI